jgi:uncharacterized protein YoaH (UPF0181 family)
MNATARHEFAPLFDDLKQAVQIEFLRCQQRREAVDILEDACNRLVNMGVHIDVCNTLDTDGISSLTIKATAFSTTSAARAVPQVVREEKQTVPHSAALPPKPPATKPAAVKAPAVATPTHPSGQAVRWSAEEDAKAVEGMLDFEARGLSFKESVKLVAEALGRPYEGTYSRLRKVLAYELSAARLKRCELAAKAVAQEEVVALAPEQVTPPAAVASDAGVTIPWGQRIFRDHLNALGNPEPFSPLIDHSLVSDLGQGTKLNMIAADLGIDAKQLLDRWIALTKPSVTPRGGLSPNDQKYLLAELKSRMQAKAEVLK